MSKEPLFIDIGNSFIKIAVKADFGWQLLYNGRVDREEEFFSWLETRRDHRLVCCSVVKRLAEKLQGKNSTQITMLDSGRIPSELNEYKTPRTLGMDRFLACYGASVQTPGPVVVIDAGSACTIDYMTSGSIFRGGVIMPGLETLRQAFTGQLPSLPEVDDTLPSVWPGLNTEDSLRWGINGMFSEALSGFLRKYRSTFGVYELFVTGGGAESVSRHLAAEYGPRIRPYLVFEGMEAYRERISDSV